MATIVIQPAASTSNVPQDEIERLGIALSYNRRLRIEHQPHNRRLVIDSDECSGQLMKQVSLTARMLRSAESAPWDARVLLMSEP